MSFNEPKIKHDSFGADLANAFTLSPVYRNPRMHVHPGKDTRGPEEKRNVPKPEPVYPNIGVPHTECARRETYGGAYVGKLGDVRRCQHGKIQMLVKPTRDWYGPGAWFWVTLHPFFDFGRYRKAKKLL